MAAFSSVPGSAGPGALTPGLILFPSQGPPIRPLQGPVRARPLVPLRGRAGSNPGTPAASAPVPPLITGALGVPYTNWAAGSMYTSG